MLETNESAKHERPRAYVSISPMGIFAFSENQDMIYFELFDKNPKIAYEQFEKGLTDEFLKKLKDYDVECSELSNRVMREKMRELATDLRFASNDQEFNEFISDFSCFFTKKRMKFSFSKDRFVVQANNALEDVLKISNAMSERLKEWFGLHYPECRFSQRELVSHVLTFGRRENFPGFNESVGLEISKEDEDVIRSFAGSVEKISEERKVLEKYVRESIKELAPNTSCLVDELLLAKLISTAGSIEKLARMSASSIQLLGAEKALFRHLRKQGKAPKFGLIFMSSWIQNTKEEKRGKVARILASKLMQSIRIDFYSGRDESERLKKELDEEIKRISD